MTQRFIFLEALSLALPLAFGPTPAQAADLLETATNAGYFTKFLEAVQQAGLTALLRTPGPFTVFAPNDSAFAALPPGTVSRLMDPANTVGLAKVLSYHLVAGRLGAADVSGLNADLKALTGQSLVMDGRSTTLTVNGAKILQVDIQADNGTMHVIDEVLIPPIPVQPNI